MIELIKMIIFRDVDESPLEAGTDDLDSEASLYPSEDGKLHFYFYKNSFI